MSLFDDDDLIYDDEENFSSDFGDNSAFEKLKEPRDSDFCVGHGDQEQLFINLYKNNVMPHALIFSGLEGIGKTTMAFRLARFLLKHGKEDTNQDGLFGAEDVPQDITTMDVSADDPVFTRVASGGHADLLHIARHFDAGKGKADKALKVEALRQIEPFLRKTSSGGGWRIVLVEDADTMNRNAQNAILKILEEPPQNVLIILVTHRLGMLIPTIRSRARVVTFNSLSSDIMNDLLQRQGTNLPPSDMSALADISGGSIGIALKYAEDGGLEMLSKLLSYLDDLPNHDWGNIHKLSNDLGSAAKDKEYVMFTDMMLWVVRKILFLKSRGAQELPAYLDTNGMRYIYENFSHAALIRLCDSLKSHFERVDFSNLDRRDAVRSAFLMIKG